MCEGEKNGLCINERIMSLIPNAILQICNTALTQVKSALNKKTRILMSPLKFALRHPVDDDRMRSLTRRPLISSNLLLWLTDKSLSVNCELKPSHETCCTMENHTWMLTGSHFQTHTHGSPSHFGPHPVATAYRLFSQAKCTIAE